MTAADAQRWITEPAKDSGYGRTPFQRDRARVLHSAGVPPAGRQDPGAHRRAPTTSCVPGSRTPSRSPRSPGRWAPGWAATRTWSTWPGSPTTSATRRSGTTARTPSTRSPQACGGFEGNAQTLRVLTRLEAKVPGAGLNLTRASLDASCKYPWPRKPGDRKFGVYADDLPIFDWLRPRRAGGERRCLEAQVMDWADDVAYSVHDVEDGVHGGYLSLRPLLDDPAERAALCADVAATYSDEPLDALAAALDQLLADPVVAAGRRLRRQLPRPGRAQADDQRADRPVRRLRGRRHAEPARHRAGPPVRRRPDRAAHGA